MNNPLKDPKNQIKRSTGAGALTPTAAKELGPKAVDLQKKKAASVDLPKVKKEEVMLVDKILQEIGEEKKGLWANIHAKRKRGEKPAKPGDKDYPKTLNVEGIEQARDNVGADKCWKGKKLGTPKTKMKGGKEVPNCVDESATELDEIAPAAAVGAAASAVARVAASKAARTAVKKVAQSKTVRTAAKEVGKSAVRSAANNVKKRLEPEVSESCGCETKKHGGDAGKPGKNKNYVKEIEESVRMPAKSGNIYYVMVSWRGKVYSLQMFFPYTARPSRQDIENEVRKVYPDCRVTYFTMRDYEPGQPLLQVEDWQKVNKSDKTDGMSPAAVKAYRRENPGSKLKTAVTGDPKPGSKDAKRRKSFCARSKGQQDMHNIDCSSTPDKPVCKARRRWKC